MRAVYLEKYVGHLRENEHVFENQILGSENSFKKLSKIVAQSTYLYPRLHSSLKLVIQDSLREPNANKILIQLIN